MICKVCRSNVPDGSEYCRTCGAKMVTEPVAPAAPVCVGCGAALTTGGPFCTFCGTRQPDAAPVAPEAPVEPVAPEAPVEPVAPEAPAEPVAPEAPAEPVAPEAPAEPFVPEAPVEAFAPAAPVAPVCGYCGTPLPEGSAFCINCGNPQPAGAPAAFYAPGDSSIPYNPTAPVAPKAKKPFPMQLVLLGAGVLTLILALVIVLVSCGGNSPEAVAEEFVQCMFDGDIDDAMDLMPEEVLEYISEEEEKNLDEMIEELEDEMDDAMSMANIECTISQVGEAEYYKKKDLKKIRSNYEDMYIQIEDAAEVKVTVVMEAYGMDVPQDMTIVVIQVDGDWYVDMSSVDMF